MNFNNDFNNMQNMQNDPNFLMNNQQNLLNFCLANGYQPPPNFNIVYQLAQLSQMMNKNMGQGVYQPNIGPTMPGAENMQMPGQDVNFLNILAMLQMMNNGRFGDMNTMMGNTSGENNQDNQ